MAVASFLIVYQLYSIYGSGNNDSLPDHHSILSTNTAHTALNVSTGLGHEDKNTAFKKLQIVFFGLVFAFSQ